MIVLGHDLSIDNELHVLDFEAVGAFPPDEGSFDVALVIIAVVVSLIFLRRVEGVREGTLAAAIFTGLTAKVVNIPMKKFADKFLALPETRSAPATIIIIQIMMKILNSNQIK